MTIQKLFKVTVRMDNMRLDKDAVYDPDWIRMFEGTKYKQAVGHAIRGWDEAGSDSHLELYEWATFDNAKDAVRCEDELKAIAVKFQNKEYL